MRIKHAYNTLLSSKSRGKYDSNFGSDYSYSSSQRSQSKNSQDEEEFYGFGKNLVNSSIQRNLSALLQNFLHSESV